MNENENEINKFRLQELKKKLTFLKAKVETYERELQDFFSSARTSLSWKPDDDASAEYGLGRL